MAVHQRLPSNLTELERICKEEWQRIPKSRNQTVLHQFCCPAPEAPESESQACVPSTEVARTSPTMIADNMVKNHV
ncbi:hypothetical protein PO909_029227 [Leuciscus waleckii]